MGNGPLSLSLQNDLHIPCIIIEVDMTSLDEKYAALSLSLSCQYTHIQTPQDVSTNVMSFMEMHGSACTRSLSRNVRLKWYTPSGPMVLSCT